MGAVNQRSVVKLNAISQKRNANKLIRQYTPKGTDFSTITDTFIRIIRCKNKPAPQRKTKF